MMILVQIGGFPRRGYPMSPELIELIERARRVEMTDEDRERQRISFAYGNTKFENNDITWDTVRKAAEDLKSR